MGLAATVLTALWLMLPAYLSNMLPVFVGGGTPIDFGRSMKDGRRILGNGKTWRGLLIAPLVAAALVLPLRLLVHHTGWGDVQDWPTWGPEWWWIVIAYAMGLGALTGDAVESFFKRRTGRERGERWFPWDQLDFVIGSILFGAIAATILHASGATASNYFVDVFTWDRLLAIFLLTPGLHLLVNYIGYKIGTKDVPW